MSQPPQQMQNQQMQNQPVNTDPQAFTETYLDKKTGAMIFAIILLFIGIILFLQVSCVQMTGSDPSGLAGSSATSSGDDTGEDTYNSYCAGFTEFIAVLLIIGSVYWLAYIMTVKSDSEKLVKSGHLLAACTLDAKKGVSASNELLQTQITINEQEAMRRGMEIHHLDVETDDESDRE